MVHDVRFLVDMLERVHPDPYAGYGGRVEFGRTVSSLLRTVSREPLSPAAFRSHLGEFLAGLGDGHTFISASGGVDTTIPRRYLAVTFDVAADGMYISGTTDSLSDLLGAKVLEVNGIPVDTLAARADIVYPKENHPARLRHIARGIPSRRSLSLLIGDPGAAIDLLVQQSGVPEPILRPLAFGLSRDERRAFLLTAAVGDRSLGVMTSDLIAEGSAGYFRLRGVWSREAFESMAAAGRTDIQKWLDHAYDTFGLADQPEDLDDAIQAFPSIIEKVHALLSRMKAGSIHDLIIDLRGNGGGFSVIGGPMYHLLFGEAYLRSPDPVYFATRVSREYLEINGTTLEALSEKRGRSLREGDLIYSPRLGKEAEPIPEKTFLESMRERGFSRTDLLERRPDIGTLNVIVIVDGGTFSAAFDMSYHLRRMGAKLHGSAPSQSPAGFVDSTPYELPRSGLKGSMSRTAVVYPGFPSNEGAVVLDVPVTWQMLAERGFRPDAVVEIALEELEKQ
jgi:hypothetical protein